MKKNRILAIILVSCIAIITMCGGCAMKDKDIVYLKISEESKKKAEEILAAKPAESTPEETFRLMTTLYYTRTTQNFPDTEVMNKLEHETCAGSDVYTLDNGDYENIVLYIHGGAWTLEIDPEHVSFCDELVEKLNAKVYMPLYPLAPQYTYMETYEMVAELYSELLEQGKPIYVMGDSAGANIALGVMHLIKKYESVMPAKLIVLAPCADMTFSNKEMEKIEPVDPILYISGCQHCAQIWAGDRPLDDPLLSALYADVSGFPDTMIISGTHDILYPDDLKLYEHLKKAGNKVKLVIGEGMWHVFSLETVDEKEQSLNLIQEFCKE